MMLAATCAQADLAINVFSKYQAEVDKTIEDGLEYLVNIQNEDGSFLGDQGESTGVVALAGMAFLSVGHTPGYGAYGEAIDRCIDFIIEHQDGQGVLHNGRSGHGPMYSHNISTLFLSEVSGMVDPKRQKEIEASLGRAVNVLIKAQQVPKEERHRGGWRYKPDSRDSDLSCSGWALMALRSSKLNGADVPTDSIDAAVEYVLRMHSEKAGTFGYQSGHDHAVTLTGAGLLCLELCGQHGHPSTLKAGDYILNTLDRLPNEGHASYGNYYNAQAMFQLGGKYWEKYAEWLYTYWPKQQKENGSFTGQRDGTIYNTAITLLALTVPYRQLPIYQRDETVDEE
jgi:prenyltransferase beta subunit